MGHLVVTAEEREAHLARSADAVRLARAAPGCLHFSAAADLVEPTWVVVSEVWSSRADLDAFRASGRDDEPDPFAHVRAFHVTELEAAPA